MIVVADTSPINYLVLIEQIGILPSQYTRVLIPPAVFDELTHPAAPNMVRDWTQNHPAWLEILGPKNTEHLPNWTSEKVTLLHSQPKWERLRC